ncbi:MAG: YciI family protein [Pseudomonadota bacterium]
MHFVAHALDKPDAIERRLAILASHRAYLAEAPGRFGVTILLSGPLTTDDAETIIGSFLLIEADDRQSAEALFAGEPMVEAQIWAAFHLHAVTLRQNAMQDASGAT